MAGLVALLAAGRFPDPMQFRLSSAAFANNHPIPRAHACDGDNTSPALRWDGAPPATRSLALIVHDPDAPSGDFTHWLVYDLPATLTELPSGKYASAQFPLGGLEGTNSFGNLGYGAPCPPAGPAHHYVFTIYALSAPKLGLAPGASQDDLLKAMQGKILAQATLVGLYQR
ncbi:MAG TPA: YbhB/YbcL family Raf kinase inhibitor-like protein [Terriglobales bacterium]|nr:YbhB/YbcL family Raf kinase inhibitor-like protein [Terriglobales bacterium]